MLHVCVGILDGEKLNDEKKVIGVFAGGVYGV